MIAAPAVLTAINTALKADEDLMALVTGIFERPPDGQPMPFVRTGEMTERAQNVQDRRGRELTYTVHVFSQYNGYGPALAIAKEICRILDGQPLALSEGEMWRLTFDNSWTLMEADGTTTHVPVQFRIGVQEAVS